MLIQNFKSVILKDIDNQSENLAVVAPWVLNMATDLVDNAYVYVGETRYAVTDSEMPQVRLNSESGEAELVIFLKKV